MPVSTSPRKDRHAGCAPNPDASVHDLLKDATEWLQYSRGLTELLADLLHEAESANFLRVALGLEAIGALTQGGVGAPRRHGRGFTGRGRGGEAKQLTTDSLAARISRGPRPLLGIKGNDCPALRLFGHVVADRRDSGGE